LSVQAAGRRAALSLRSLLRRYILARRQLTKALAFITTKDLSATIKTCLFSWKCAQELLIASLHRLRRPQLAREPAASASLAAATTPAKPGQDDGGAGQGDHLQGPMNFYL
jgi:hypothetical protein